MRSLAGRTIIVLVALASCRSGDVEPRGGPAPAAPVANAVAPAANVAAPAANGAGLAAPGAAGAGAQGDAEKAARPRPVAPVAPEPWHIPVGITLLIEPGKGLGPIRFGARLETIERLIAEPCEQKRQDSPHVLACRYSAQAVEFFLTDGALTSLRVHRLGRPFGTAPKPDFGIFNGRFVGGASLGMLMSGVQELLGKPRAVHPVKETNPYGTIEVHDYDGFSLEYDRLDADRVVLGGALLTAPASKAAGSAAAKPAAAKPAAAKPAAAKPTHP